MKFRLLLVPLCAALFVGCISNHETVYREVPRAKVEFESEKAGRVFYEALSKLKYHNGRESHTEFSIPVVFDHSRTVKTGEDEKFNEAVRRCDGNQDGKISEQEAAIFADQVK